MHFFQHLPLIFVHFPQHITSLLQVKSQTNGCVPFVTSIVSFRMRENNCTEHVLQAAGAPFQLSAAPAGRRRCRRRGRASPGWHCRALPLPFCSFSWQQCQGMHPVWVRLIRGMICEMLAIYLINHRHKAIKPIF